MLKLRALLALMLAICFISLSSAPAQAQIPVKWTAQLQPSDARAGEGARIVLSATINAPWYIYAPTTPAGGPNPTKITLPDNAALQMQGAIAQPEPITHMDEGFGIETQTFKKFVVFGLPVLIKAGAKGAQKAVVKVRYQACNERVCLPPKTVEVPLEFTLVAGAARPDKLKPDARVPAQIAPKADAATAKTDDAKAGETQTDAAKKDDEKAAVIGAVPPATGGGAGAIEGAGAVSSAATPLAKTIAPNLLSFIALAFGAGLLAILTPCVFPMIPITVSLFSKKTEGNRLAGPLVYCAGIIGTFTVLGVAVALIAGAQGLSRFAANPIVNIGLALLFIVLALNLFGVFEIIVPSSILNRVQPQGKSGLLAPLLMGFAFTLTSFTCTVPFVGTTLVSASTVGAFYPVVGMLAFSTAFALPFFLLALFPSFLTRLPRSGQWLVSVKAFMGFLEIAAALKFLQVADYSLHLGLLTRPVFLAIWFAIALIAGLYLLRLVRLPNDSPGVPLGPTRTVIGVATLAAAAWLLAANNGASLHDLNAYLPPRDYGKTAGSSRLAQSPASQWIVNDLEKARALARSQGKPLLINFTGYACTNCRLMENDVLPHPDVTGQLQNFVPVELFTDGTDAASLKFNAYQQAKFGTIAIPYYAVVTPDGEIKGRLEGLERDPSKFAQFLEASRSQIKVAAR